MDKSNSTKAQQIAQVANDSFDVLSAAQQHGDMIASTPAPKRLLRVLVADDCMDAADTLCTVLKLWGHDARAVYDGLAALEMVSSYRPDVLLLDISMPKMDGCHLAQQLRLQTGLAVTLIAVTGWADDAHRLLCEDAGFDDCLIKPVEPSALHKRLLLEREGLARLPIEAEKRNGNDSNNDCPWL